MRAESERGRDNEAIFCLVHGSWHGAWCWQRLQEELGSAGRKSIAPDLPFEDPNKSLDDHAAIIRKEELKSGATEIIRVGWSWGANVIPRALGSNVVRKLIFVAGSFHPATLRRSVTGEELSIRSLSYEVARNTKKEGLREMADYVFYHDVEDEELRENAKNELKWYPRREIEPELTRFPHLPLEYILLANDHALRHEAQTSAAEALGVKPVYFESGHAPMLSRPKELARLLIKLANRS